MSLEDFEKMEDFKSMLSDESQAESKLRGTVREFGSFIPDFLCETTVEIPRRALDWTNQTDPNG